VHVEHAVVLQDKQELGAVPLKYFPGAHVLHLLDVPSKQVAQSLWQVPQVFVGWIMN
jgi:hypothetical protein